MISMSFPDESCSLPRRQTQWRRQNVIYQQDNMRHASCTYLIVTSIEPDGEMYRMVYIGVDHPAPERGENAYSIKDTV